MDKVAEILKHAPGMAIMGVRKEVSDSMNIVFAVSYEQFWKYKVKREKSISEPSLPYLGPIGELAEPVENVKQAIMNALRDRVLDAADLPGLESHIQLSKMAFDLQSRYKLSLSALWNGYDRLLQSIHATNDS